MNPTTEMLVGSLAIQAEKKRRAALASTDPEAAVDGTVNALLPVVLPESEKDHAEAHTAMEDITDFLFAVGQTRCGETTRKYIRDRIELAMVKARRWELAIGRSGK